MRLTAAVLDAPDPGELAEFYLGLLDWTELKREQDWVEIGPPDGGTGLSFQAEPLYVPPKWPAAQGNQQMMLHLDIEVDDLETASAHALTCGAVLADFQPQEKVKVFLDPVGHPFCLYVPE